MGGHFVQGEAFAGLHDDERHRHLTPTLVRSANHGYLSHLGVFDQNLLNLNRVDFSPPEMSMSFLRSTM